ncbi:MAG: RebB family R body protein [Acidobacteriota bacterium]|nr:RebB family R body protein [Acidobacteriota bacterium]
MNSPEKVISEQQTASAAGAGAESDVSNYARLFCEVMSQLNAVSMQQTESLLSLAVTVAEKLHSINSRAGAQGEQLDGFINQIKSAAADLSQIKQSASAPENLSAQSATGGDESSQPASSGESFPAAVEQALADAVRNSVANQQQLNTIGEAMLTQSATLLFSLAAARAQQD